MDVNYFYLNNHMDREDYILIQISKIPQEFLNVYNIKDKFHIVYIFEQVTKLMYGLPQAGLIAHDALVQHLTPYGYHHSSKTAGKLTQKIQPINFTLVVDDSSIKYSEKEHSLYLKAELEDR